jgi:hypothetical protein
VPPWNGDEYIDNGTTESVFRWCPTCSPEGTVIPEPWEMFYCEVHRGGTSGESDRLIVETYIPQGEAGGDDSRKWCDFIHRGDR